MRRFALGIASLAFGWFAAAKVDARTSEPMPVPRLEAPPRGVAFVFAVIAVPPAPKPALDAPIGRFHMTRYYVAEEGVASDDVTIYDKRGCRPLASMTATFAHHLDVQGTGKLLDGRVVNVSGPCGCGHSPCYRVMSDKAQWGMSAISRPLKPFRSIAVDPSVVKLGSILYVAELDGLTMPGTAPWGGFVHDGCVVATDVGGGIDGMQIDFFVGKRAYKQALDARRKMKHVTVYPGGERCKKPGRNARNASI
jgi:3D (Asp-Asp-Asp) domain-containing protein